MQMHAKGTERCSGAWWAISIEDGVRVNWHANVCAQPIYSPPAHLHCSHLCPKWGSWWRGKVQAWQVAMALRHSALAAAPGQDQEVAWATTTVATALGLRLSRQPLLIHHPFSGLGPLVPDSPWKQNNSSK